MARMTCNVYVLTEEGSSLLLKAGSPPPEWALPQLGAHTITDLVTGIEPEPRPIDGASDVGIPPVKGKGSSAKAWAEYAAANGYEVDDDAKASEIREALAEAGIPIQ